MGRRVSELLHRSGDSVASHVGLSLRIESGVLETKRMERRSQPRDWRCSHVAQDSVRA